MRKIDAPQTIRLGTLTRARISLMVIASVAAPLMLIVHHEVFHEENIWATATATLVLYLLVLARMVGLFRSWEFRSHELAATIEDLALLQYERDQLLREAVHGWESKRSHIASELHDGPIQSLTALGYTVERLSILADASNYQELPHVIDEIARKLSDEVNSLRFVMTELRPPALAEHGLCATVGQYLEEFQRRTGVVPHAELHLSERLSEGEEVTLFRIVQEGLTNVAKHANASLVNVTLEQREGSVVLEIEDDGTGFDAARRGRLLEMQHFGLAIMVERAKIIGGDIEITSKRGEGTNIVATFPWGGWA
jgi:signal transduction histidine kinase